MNIDDLTLGQIKEMKNMFNCETDPKTHCFNKFRGKYVIARTRNAGVIFGKVIEAGIGYLHMVEARRLYRIVSKDKSLSWYEGVAVSGLCETNGIISGSVERIIVEDFELTLCSEDAINSLTNFKTNETTY